MEVKRAIFKIDGDSLRLWSSRSVTNMSFGRAVAGINSC